MGLTTLEIGEAKSEVVLRKWFRQVPWLVAPAPHFPEERSKLFQMSPPGSGPFNQTVVSSELWVF